MITKNRVTVIQPNPIISNPQSPLKILTQSNLIQSNGSSPCASLIHRHHEGLYTAFGIDSAAAAKTRGCVVSTGDAECVGPANPCPPGAVAGPGTAAKPCPPAGRRRRATLNRMRSTEQRRLAGGPICSRLRRCNCRSLSAPSYAGASRNPKQGTVADSIWGRAYPIGSHFFSPSKSSPPYKTVFWNADARNYATWNCVR